VTGIGTTGHIPMFMSMDIGHDQNPDVHTKQDIGKANHGANFGSKVAGTMEIKNQTIHMIVTEGNCPKPKITILDE